MDFDLGFVKTEVFAILRGSDGISVAFTDAKLVFDPSGEVKYDDERRSNGDLLPDTNKASSPGENASVNGGGVESKEKDGAVSPSRPFEKPRTK